jgi:hypothetical protein
MPTRKRSKTVSHQHVLRSASVSAPAKRRNLIAKNAHPPNADPPSSTPRELPIRIRLKLPQPVFFPWRECLPRETLIGIADDYLDHHQVMVTTLLDELMVGDRLHIRGRITDLFQTIQSIQVNHEAVRVGEIGQEVGIKVDQKVRKHDYVYRLIPEL